MTTERLLIARGENIGMLGAKYRVRNRLTAGGRRIRTLGPPTWAVFEKRPGDYSDGYWAGRK